MTTQFIRKGNLVVGNDDQLLDLSNLHFTFQVRAAEVESPTNAWIRVFNVAETTIARIRKEFTKVVLQAGYAGNVGVIFEGTIKQFRLGRVDGKTTYFDILAADGDIAYNNAVVNKTLAAGSNFGDRIAAISESMRKQDVSGTRVLMQATGGTLPRGKVFFGMSRTHMRNVAESMGATWSIQKGTVTVLPKNKYAPGQVVVLNGQTGLIGRPEQTVDGIRARCLINPSIVVGGRVQIDNAAINYLAQQDPNGAPVPYNQWAALQHLATIASDGIYRVYVIEYDGDSRGQEWYADLTLLAIDTTVDQVLID